jgi:DNA-binding transcriptional LysR family regulator
VARVGSIRKAAEELAITSTALNRRILSMEDELGVPIFDRLPSGVRLSVAGELFIHHVRKQLSDLQRVKSQIADLAGERRGHISIVCGQALMNSFMPKMIAQYQLEHPAVTFDVQVCSRHDVEDALSDYSADIALIFEPRLSKDFHCVIDVPQPLQMVCIKGHPLAGRSQLRLSECAEYPMALPTRANGVRHLLEQAAVRMSLQLPVIIESNSQTMIQQSLLQQNLLTFQIPLGAGGGEHGLFQQSSIDSRDVGEGRLYLGHLRGRNLPVASARFIEQLAGALDQRFGEEK